jgi:histidinol-phosphatase (PHP family)
MQRACARAVELGLPSVAFTEHVDFTDWGAGDGLISSVKVGIRPYVIPLDIEGYQADLQRCRDLFPQLRVVSGIEAGEPHHFAGSVAAVLAAGRFDRVLGSLHAIDIGGALEYVDDSLFEDLGAQPLMRQYFTEMLQLVEGSSAFGVLAHCDFPRRYWPDDAAGPFREQDFEEEYRAVFRALASSGRALEVNTRSPLASVELVRWWREEGGDAVSFGSDAHQPYRVGARFALAADIVTAAGFKPGRDEFDFWRR